MDFSEITIGTAPMGSRYTEEQSLRVLAAALDSGITAIDTAPSYGYGAAEGIVGRALARSRTDPIIITKVGIEATPLAQNQMIRDLGRRVLQLGGPAKRMLRSAISSQRREAALTPDSVDSSIERSLRALGREISFVVLHGVDIHGDCAKACLTRLAEHVRAGRIQGIGVSGTASTVEACSDLVEVAMLQTPVRSEPGPRRQAAAAVLGYSPFATIPDVAATSAQYEKWAQRTGSSVSFEAAVIADIDAAGDYTSLISTMGSALRVEAILSAIAVRRNPDVMAAARQLRSMYVDQP